jgi:hypothetical protein
MDTKQLLEQAARTFAESHRLRRQAEALVAQSKVLVEGVRAQRLAPPGGDAGFPLRASLATPTLRR